jgi:hypothetical protein
VGIGTPLHRRRDRLQDRIVTSVLTPMGIKYQTVVRGGIRYYVRAIDDGVVVGRMTGRVVVQRPDRGRRQVWVGNIKVREDRRREGIATGMARTLHKRFPN